MVASIIMKILLISFLVNYNRPIDVNAVVALWKHLQSEWLGQNEGEAHSQVFFELFDKTHNSSLRYSND